jgi:hypothetical protein
MHMPFPLLAHDQLLARDPLLTYDRLQQCYRKGVRTRTWRRLHHLDKALFRASLDYLRRGGRIMHDSLLVKLERVVEQLTETRGTRIAKRGLAKAAALLRDGAEQDIFGWAPQFKSWLQDPDFIFWLRVGGSYCRALICANEASNSADL